MFEILHLPSKHVYDIKVKRIDVNTLVEDPGRMYPDMCYRSHKDMKKFLNILLKDYIAADKFVTIYVSVHGETTRYVVWCTHDGLLGCIKKYNGDLSGIYHAVPFKPSHKVRKILHTIHAVHWEGCDLSE